MKQNRALILIVIWLLVMVSVIASTVTLLAADGTGVGRRWVGRDEYAMLQRYARLEEVRSILEEEFYREVDEQTLLSGALKGMMAAVEDDYTFYYTPDEMALHDQQTRGEYSGVGLLVQNNADGYIEIIRVYRDGPGADAGLQAGDLIVEVDGVPVSGQSAAELNTAVALMKGEDGTQVKLRVLRSGEAREAFLQRGEVTIDNVSSSVIDEGIGYISIFQFAGNAVEDFRAALQDVQSKGTEALVIDLRNNPGGVLEDVVAIADMLLPEGCVVYTQTRSGSRQDYYSDKDYCDLPLVVLVNGMSASASEILAAAVQDYGRGAVVGTQTYGKGIVQTVITFEDDGAGMQYTSACYYTPDGKNIHGVGVAPDEPVEAAEGFTNYSGIPDLENDVQLQRALELLKAE